MFLHETDRLLHEILEELKALYRIEQVNGRTLEDILKAVTPTTSTPITISFQETSMNPPVAGQTQVFTGTLTPTGSAFSTGTTFAVVSSDPNAAASVDATGLIVTIVYDAAFVDNPASPFNAVYTASGIVPVPSASPTSITATITPSIPTTPTPTPTGITFAQTT